MVRFCAYVIDQCMQWQRIPYRRPSVHGRIFGKRTNKYGVFYRILSRAVTGVNREIIKQFFQSCAVVPGYIAKRLAVPVGHLNACLRGILGCGEGLEVVQQHDDAFKDEEMRSIACNSEY